MNNIEWLQNPKLYSRAEIIAEDCPVPKVPGVYAWFFKEIPGNIPTDDCLKYNGLTLLYLGCSPQKPSSHDDQKSNLRKRLRTHFMNDADGSTLRKSLGILIARKTGYSLRIVRSNKNKEKNQAGKRKRMTFTNPGEQALDKWLDENAFVAFLPQEEPWVLLRQLFGEISLPLNLDSPKLHPFHQPLSKWRSQAKRNAKKQEEVEEQGSER